MKKLHTHKHLCSYITHILYGPSVCRDPITDMPMLFYPFAILFPGQTQHSLETQHGSVPIIAIVAIFIALKVFQSRELLFVLTATVKHFAALVPDSLH